jgi:hypothetical protein
MSETVKATPYGFTWGPMRVERSVADDDIGWVLTIRDERGVARAEVRVTPKGKKWRLRGWGVNRGSYLAHVLGADEGAP